MNAIVSTELLLRVAQATPEQQARIERILADGGLGRSDNDGALAIANSTRACRGDPVAAALARLEEKLDDVCRGLAAALKDGHRAELDDAVSDDELRRIYARVLLAAEEEDSWREAPIKEVFDSYCLKSFSAQEIAIKLGCSKTTVMNRLAALKRLAGVEPKKLRVYKPFFEQAEAALRDPRARRVRRRDAIYGDEPEEDGTR